MATKLILASLRIKGGKESEFFELFNPIVDATRKETGCIRYDIFRNTRNDREFMFVEEYVDEAAYQSHRQMPYMTPMRPKRDAMVEKYLGIIER